MTKINSRGVPAAGVLACTVVGYGCVVISAISPDTVFLFLINSSGAVFLFVYLMICLSQMILRRKLGARRAWSVQYKIWGYPTCRSGHPRHRRRPGLDGLQPGHPVSLYQSLLAWAILLAIFAARALPHRKRTAAVAGPTSTTPSAAGR